MRREIIGLVLMYIAIFILVLSLFISYAENDGGSFIAGIWILVIITILEIDEYKRKRTGEEYSEVPR